MVTYDEGPNNSKLHKVIKRNSSDGDYIDRGKSTMPKTNIICNFTSIFSISTVYFLTQIQPGER